MAISFPLVVEFEVLYVSGATIDSRIQPIQVDVMAGQGAGTTLMIGQDRFFFWTACGVPGTIALEDTDGAFHTYRLEIQSTGAVALYFDNGPAPRLVSSLFTDLSCYSALQGIAWGEGSNSTFVTARWRLFRHNAHLTGCPVNNHADWRSSSGILPQRACPGWLHVDDASPEIAQPSNGLLRLETSSLTELMYYTQAAPVLGDSYPIILEARLRWISGQSTDPDYTHIQLGITSETDTGTPLFIGPGEIFLWQGNDLRGQAAALDTSQLHDYRMEVDSAGGVRVFVDGETDPRLVGQTYVAADWSDVRAIFWGDGTRLASGVSEWESVRTNQWEERGDVDSDGALDRCDRDDGSLFVEFEIPEVVAWQEELGFDHWNLYKGDLLVLRDDGVYTQQPGSNPLADRFCGLIEPSREDAAVPPPGSVAFFLPTGVAGGVEGSLGRDSSGALRVNTNPCP